MVNSGISTVGLITPYKYRSVIDHVGAGKEWSLDRKHGGLFILPGSLFGVTSSEARFMLRDLKHNLVYLKRSIADYVVLTASDVVYNMDYRVLVDQHVRSGADITMLYHEAVEDAPHDLGVELDGDKVTSFIHGIKKGENIFRNCFVISRELLMNIISWYAAEDFLDIFEAIEPDLSKMDIRAYRFGGYIRTIDDIRDYYLHSMDLLQDEVRRELFSHTNPIKTKVQDSVPTKYLEGCSVKNSLIPAGCFIKGTVENSILFRDVTVGEGAVVRNSIVMQHCAIEPGACVENAILDRGNTVASGTVLKGSPENVFIGNGSDDVLAAAFRAFFNSDKPILFPDITYSFYPVWCELLKIPFKTLPVDDNYGINAEDYAEPNGGVVIANPNAPTSIGRGLDFIRRILDLNRDCIVIVDEAYIDFGGESAVRLLGEYENLLVTQTFSKSRSMAGMRIGMAFGSEELINMMGAVKDSYNSYPMDRIAIAAGVASVEDDDYFRETTAKIIATRDRTAERLRSLGFDVPESSTNFLFAQHKTLTAKRIFEYTREKGIYIRYWNKPRINDRLRITIGTDEQMDKLAAALEELVNG